MSLSEFYVRKSEEGDLSNYLGIWWETIKVLFAWSFDPVVLLGVKNELFLTSIFILSLIPDPYEYSNGYFSIISIFNVSYLKYSGVQVNLVYSS